MKSDARTIRSRLSKVKFRRANRTFIQPAAVNAGLKRRPRYTSLEWQLINPIASHPTDTARRAFGPSNLKSNASCSAPQQCMFYAHGVIKGAWTRPGKLWTS
jgi:hypothetical protein